MEQQNRGGGLRVVNQSILDAISNLFRRRGLDAAPSPHDHRLSIRSPHNVDRQSIEYLVDILQGDTVGVTELELHDFHLLQPSDGGLNALCDFFTNQTTLTTVWLLYSDFGSMEEALQLIAAVQSNRFITDLAISGIENLEDAEFGTCLSGLLQHTPHLQRLELGPTLNTEVIRALQPGLRANRTLKELDLSWCQIGNEGLVLLVDALVGNTTMELLDISYNRITTNGLDDITRLLELTQLKKIDFGPGEIFDVNTITHRFVQVLSRHQFLKSLYIQLSGQIGITTAAMIFQALESNTTLEIFQATHYAGHLGFVHQFIESLPRIKGLKRLMLPSSSWVLYLQHVSFLPALHQNTSLEELASLNDTTAMTLNVNEFPGQHREAVVAANNILARNSSLRRAASLLALQPRTGLPIGSKSGIWYNAMAQMGRSSSGASAIFDIFQKRPALLEKQLKRPQQQQTADEKRARCMS